jgi:hypothetical protein
MNFVATFFAHCSFVTKKKSDLSDLPVNRSRQGMSEALLAQAEARHKGKGASLMELLSIVE